MVNLPQMISNIMLLNVRDITYKHVDWRVRWRKDDLNNPFIFQYLSFVVEYENQTSGNLYNGHERKDLLRHFEFEFEWPSFASYFQHFRTHLTRSSLNYMNHDTP